MKTETLTEEQQKTFDMLISKGGRHYPEDGCNNVVWWQSRALLIQKDGTFDEL